MPPSFRIASEAAHQWVTRIDLVVAVGPDQKQVMHVRVSGQIGEQGQRPRVEPLQVVEEEHQRMRGLGEDADELPEHHLETVLRLAAAATPARAAGARSRARARG